MAEILFYYPVATLLDKIKMHSGMVARMIPEGTEKYAISTDETTWFHSEMDRNIREVFGIVQKLAAGIVDALIFNQPSTIGGADHRYGFYVNNNDAINENSVRVIDGYFEKLIVAMLLNAWWLKCGLADQYKISLAEIQAIRSDLNNSLFALYKTAPTGIVTSQNTGVELDVETGVESDL